MATSYQQKGLKKLFEQSMEAGGLPEFRKNWNRAIGLHNVETPSIGIDGQFAGNRMEQAWNPEDRAIDHNAFGVGEALYAVCGPNWRNSLDAVWYKASGARFEGFGGDVMAGDTPYVSAGLDVIAGLLNARALQRAAHPEWIWDRVCQVQEAVGEGGFHIGSRLAPTTLDNSGTDLADGQSLPTGKVISTRIHRNRTLNQGRRMKVNLYALRDDLTSQIMETVDEFSVAVLSERERKVADALLGVSTGTTLASGVAIGTVGRAMPMVQDSLAFFPWQNGVYNTNANATVPAPENQAYVANFANCYDSNGTGMTNYQVIANAIQVLHTNRDPFTKLPRRIDFNRMQFLVPPAVAATQLKVLLQQQALWQIAWGSATPSSISTATVSDYNLIKQFNLEILESQFFFNRLVDAGVYSVSSSGAATHATLTNNQGDTYNTPGSIMSSFYMGHFRDALVYWQRMPYQTIQVPLGSVEYGEQTVLVQDHRERGQVFWIDPRLVWRQWA